MKKLIVSSTLSEYDRNFVYNLGKQSFSVKVSESDDPYEFRFQISEIHPYDLTDYAWAKKVSPMEVNFYDDGKVIDRMTVPDYEEDDFESIGDYYQMVIDNVCEELRSINKSKNPRIDRT